MLIAPKQLKLRTSNLTCMFPGTARTWPLKLLFCKNPFCGECTPMSAFYFCFFIGDPMHIVMIWKVIFANKSRKLGWIWMKLGRWGWGLKRLSLARLQWNRTVVFRESVKNGSQRRSFFVTETTHHFCHFPWIDFHQNFPRTRVLVVARDTWFHISEKFPLRGRISWKTVFF